MRTSRRLSCFACSNLAAALAAQTPPSDGPLVGMPVTFGIDDATSLGTPMRGAEYFLKVAGFQTAPPVPLPLMPVDFSPAAVLGPYMPPPYPDIDAVSHGLDVIPADSSGVVVVPPGHWNFLAFSVRRGCIGAPGGALNAEVGTPGENEADLFSYVFRGASCIPPEFIDRTFKFADSIDYGMPLPGEVDSLDLAMNVYDLESVVTPTLGLPACPAVCPEIYYSLEGSLANLGLWPPGLWGGQAPSGAVVFKSTWTGSAWGPPTLAFTPAQLDLPTCADLDALAVDAYDPGGVQVLFSTVAGGCVAQDQLMFKDCPCDAPAVALRYGEGTLVSTRLGLVGGDDVDAICVGDPLCQGSRQNRPGVLELERTLAEPWLASVTFGFPRQLATQALRLRLPPAFGFQYRLLAVGGPPGGLGAVLVTVPSLYPIVFPLQLSFGVPATSPFPGHPATLHVQLPSSMLGAELVLQMAAVPLVPPLNVQVSHALRLKVH